MMSNQQATGLGLDLKRVPAINPNSYGSWVGLRLGLEQAEPALTQSMWPLNIKSKHPKLIYYYFLFLVLFL